MSAPTRKLLFNGGEVFLNHLPTFGWSVDLWEADQDPHDEPAYHAFYTDEESARADFDSWQEWPV